MYQKEKEQQQQQHMLSLCGFSNLYIRDSIYETLLVSVVLLFLLVIVRAIPKEEEEMSVATASLTFSLSLVRACAKATQSTYHPMAAMGTTQKGKASNKTFCKNKSKMEVGKECVRVS